MKTLAVNDFGVENLTVIDAQDPVAADGEVLIRSEAATINPADFGLVSGAAAARIPEGAQRPYTPGWDVVGTVVSVGAGVPGKLVGKRVLGFTIWFESGRGTQSSLVALPASDVTVAPDVLPSAQLTTVGLNGLTAWRGIDELDPQPGEILAVTGAAGSVGGYAAQLALARGVDVVAVVHGKDRDVAASLGATYVIDSDGADLRADVLGVVGRGVDAVLDTATMSDAALALARDGGRYVTVTDTPSPVRDISVTRVFGRMDRRGLPKLVAMASAGQLRTPLAQTFPLDRARDAYSMFQAGVRHGRIVLTF